MTHAKDEHPQKAQLILNYSGLMDNIKSGIQPFPIYGLLNEGFEESHPHRSWYQPEACVMLIIWGGVVSEKQFDSA